MNDTGRLQGSPCCLSRNMKTRSKFNRLLKQRKQKKMFKQPEAKSCSLVLLNAGSVIASGNQEMHAESRQLVIFKSQVLCLEVR